MSRHNPRHILFLVGLLVGITALGVTRQTSTRRALVDGSTRAMLPEKSRDYADSTHSEASRYYTPSKVLFSNYSKTLSAKKETFTVENLTEEHITCLHLAFYYYDTAGALLLRRTVDVPCDLPSGQKQTLAIKSLDRQCRYWFHLGATPRKSGGIPFMLTYKLLSYDIRLR